MQESLHSVLIHNGLLLVVGRRSLQALAYGNDAAGNGQDADSDGDDLTDDAQATLDGDELAKLSLTLEIHPSAYLLLLFGQGDRGLGHLFQLGPVFTSLARARTRTTGGLKVWR